MHNKNVSQRLIGAVRMFRIRVATSESKLKVLREEAQVAKRRRKEVKRLAQRARKQFKRSKAELAELRQALAKAEAKLFRAGGRALARKMAKPGPITNRGARSSRKPPAGTNKSPAVVSAASRAPGRPTPRKSAPNRLSSSRKAAPGGRALTSDQSATQPTDAKAL
jgi:hypothetical protein